MSIDGPDSGAMKTENSSEGDGKDTGAPKQVDDAKEGDSDDDSGDDDEEFDPASLTTTDRSAPGLGSFVQQQRLNPSHLRGLHRHEL